jgi:hypothetical protein
MIEVNSIKELRLGGPTGSRKYTRVSFRSHVYPQLKYGYVVHPCLNYIKLTGAFPVKRTNKGHIIMTPHCKLYSGTEDIYFNIGYPCYTL